MSCSTIRQFEIHKRAQILSAQKAAGSFAVEVGKQIEEIGWILDEAGNSKFVRVIPMVWVFGRDRAHARELAARAKRLWESEPLPWIDAGGELPQSDPAPDEPAIRAVSGPHDAAHA
jgi:hypothetical protein